MLHDGILQSPWRVLWGAYAGHELVGLLHIGPNLVASGDCLEVADVLAAAIPGPGAVRVFLGERELIERVWRTVAPRFPAPRQVRAGQLVYRMDPGALRVPVPEVGGRLAEAADEDRVLVLSAAMHNEEMGEDPLALDPFGYRLRVRTLISRGWTYLYEVGGEIAFKMDIGCAGPLTGQIQGVYVPAHLRGKGLGREGMAAACALALRQHPALSLYVNPYNHRAIGLYEQLGFLREPYEFTTVLLP